MTDLDPNILQRVSWYSCKDSRYLFCINLSSSSLENTRLVKLFYIILSKIRLQVSALAITSEYFLRIEDNSFLCTVFFDKNSQPRGHNTKITIIVNQILCVIK